jgi:hypothetical protein
VHLVHQNWYHISFSFNHVTSLCLFILGLHYYFPSILFIGSIKIPTSEIHQNVLPCVDHSLTIDYPALVFIYLYVHTILRYLILLFLKP